MASVQANPEMPGQGPLAANITREQIQHVFQVRTGTLPRVPLRPPQLPLPTKLTNTVFSAIPR